MAMVHEDLPNPPADVLRVLKDLISATEVANIAGYTRQGIHQTRKHVWSAKIGNMVVFYRPQIMAYIKAMDDMGDEKFGMR